MKDNKQQVIEEMLTEYKKMFPKDYLEKFQFDLGAMSTVAEHGLDQVILAHLFVSEDYKKCVFDAKELVKGMVRFLFIAKKTGNIIENSINNWVVAEE